MSHPLMLASNTPRARAFCFGGCGHQFRLMELKRYCTATPECRDHLGPLCEDCHRLHILTTHLDPRELAHE